MRVKFACIFTGIEKVISTFPNIEILLMTGYIGYHLLTLSGGFLFLGSSVIFNLGGSGNGTTFKKKV
jgi:hypothetical protein